MSESLAPSTVGSILVEAIQSLRAAGVESARLDARILAAHALGLAPMALFSHPERPLSPDEAHRIRALVERRAEREPVSHLTGLREFWSLEFRVTSATLDPRPDTECLIEQVLARLPDRAAPLRLVDFGTGSGCILLALLSELPQARGIGVDLSPEALAVAAENARTLGLAGRADFRLRNWDEGMVAPVDLILSNPPYIPLADLAALEPEVTRYEPHLALVGGVDGLDCYRSLAPAAARLLASGGLVAFEVGAGQAADVADLLRVAGLERVEIARDLGGIERVVLGYKK